MSLWQKHHLSCRCKDAEYFPNGKIYFCCLSTSSGRGERGRDGGFSVGVGQAKKNADSCESTSCLNLYTSNGMVSAVCKSSRYRGKRTANSCELAECQINLLSTDKML
jgi:hypothetical protein